MKKRIFITATNTDIGKTYTTLALMEHLSAQGVRVGVIKPIETGVQDGHYPDGEVLLEQLKRCNSSCHDLCVEDVVPIAYTLPAAPFVASGGAAFDFEKVTAAIEKMERYCDLLLIEGAGGLMVPVDYSFMMLDLIRFFNANALLVTHCALGCINDTLLSYQALQDNKIPTVVAFNCRDNADSFAAVSLPYFEKRHFAVMQVERDLEAIAAAVMDSFKAPSVVSL